jgi:hypothetical protein
LIKTINMEDLQILDNCRELEIMAEQLYRYFSGLFQENRELADLWEKTSNEEANHAQQFVLAIRNKKEMLESVSIDSWTVTTTLAFARNLLENAKKSPPGVVDALQIGVMLEERLASLHLEYIAVFAEESQKMLFRAMMASDNRHMEALLAALGKYSNVPH